MSSPRFRAWRVALSLASGAALALAFPDYNLPLLGWLSAAGLMLAIFGSGLVEAASCGFLYGVAFYTLSVPWIYTVMRQYGPLPVLASAGVMALLVIASALYFVLFAVAFAWIARRRGGWAIAAAPFLWVAVEFLRTQTPDIGFPWNLLGYTASGNLALAQVAAFTGIYGLSLLVAAYNAALAWAIVSLRITSSPVRRGPLLAWFILTALAAAVALGGGRWVPQAAATHVAHLVQTNLPQSTSYPVDWDTIHAPDMAQLESVTAGAGQRQPGLVVWPEVPAPFSLEDSAFAKRAAALARESQSDFLLGVVDWKRIDGNRQAPYNSAALLDPAGREQFLYDKRRLVPFSEYVPWRRWLWFAGDLTALVGDFHTGSRYTVGELPGGRFSVFICYEAVFPDEIRRFVADGADLLINISNDGWFGRSAAPAQHLAMARVRAIENRRWLLRDTNNGYTVSVDPYGRIVARLAPDVRGELDAPYAFREDTTVYTRWGDWVAWLAVAASALALLAAFLGPRPREGQRPAVLHDATA